MNYFRINHSHHTFAEMQNYTSADGGDELEEVGGLCVTNSVSSLVSNTAFFRSDNAEIVILRGQKLAEIYDGFRIYPTAEVARFSYAEFIKKLEDETIFDYE